MGWAQKGTSIIKLGRRENVSIITSIYKVVTWEYVQTYIQYKGKKKEIHSKR